MPLFHHAGALGDFLLGLPFLRALARGSLERSWTLAAAQEHARLVSRILPFGRSISGGAEELMALSARRLDPDRIAGLAARHGGLFGFVLRPREIEAILADCRPDLPAVLLEPLVRAVPGGRSIESLLAEALDRLAAPWSAPDARPAERLGPEGFAIDPSELPPLPPGEDPLGRLGLEGGGRMALIHPGAGDPAKRASMDVYAQIGRGLEARGWQVAWVRGPVEIERGDALPPGPSLEAVDLVVLAHAIARAGLYAGNDTGPTHLASALGVPTVAIHARPNRLWRPRGRRVVVVEGDGAFPGPDEVLGEILNRLP